MNNRKFFVYQLLQWNKRDNTREMPWKYEIDPYKIWISEIILQQTRVGQGLEYYNRFIKRFPNVQDIALADEDEVFKFWEGLGYYSRCKNIIASANYIYKVLKGIFPNNYEEILQLKGVGSYTASAIASFAYNLPHAVLDGNVYRVLSRYFGIKNPIDNTEGKKYYSSLAHELLDKKKAGIYNQSIMDFGATVCKPLPLCTICPLNTKCVAFLNELTQVLPVKEKSIVKRNRWMYYLVVECRKNFYVKKREGKDIWQNLYEFILIEKNKELSINKLQASKEFVSIFGKNLFSIKNISRVYRQQLTHQIIQGRFLHLISKKQVDVKDYQLLSQEKIKKLPFPKFINTYLRD